MDFNATIDLIIRELEEAREIIDDLKKFPGVQVLQVELAKSKCKSAGEVIALLKTLQNAIPVEEKDKKSVAAPQKKDHTVMADQHESKPDDLHLLPGLEKNVPDKSEIIPQEIQNISDETYKSGDITDKTEKTLIKSEKKPYVAPIIADNFSHLAASFNEQAGSEKDNDDLSKIIKTKHLTNLSEAIGVNDRFFYIREVFNGNREAYSQAISRLEKAENMTEARMVIMSYKNDKDENEAVRQLLNLVKRKFTANE